MLNEKLSQKNLVVLPVEPVIQEFNYDCGKAAVKTLLKTLKIEMDEEILQDILRTNKVSGTHPSRILELFSHLGLQFFEKVGATVADIEEKIREGYYCMVVYQAWGSPEEHTNLESGHYSLAYGYDDEAIHLADPDVWKEDDMGMGEGLRTLEKNNFDQDWRDQDYQGNLYDHWMVAVKKD
ncbi:MAG TPA: cysteine peptidase family C39 domain-containing protein [Patescibacteria group bacterium]